MRGTTRISLTACFFLVTGAALAAPKSTAKSPAEVTLRGASIAGSACPAQQIAPAVLAPDKHSLEITMPDFKAEGQSGKPIDRKKCGAIVSLDHSPGWQVAIVAAEFDLHGKVAAKIDGEVAYVHHFQGRAEETAGMAKAFQGTLPGGHEKYEFPDLWSPCGKGVTVVPGIEARVPGPDAGTDTNTLAVSKALKLTLKWQRCKA